MESKRIVLELDDRRIPIRIPKKFISEFKDELRIVVRHPWIYGIPLPDILLEKLNLEELRKDYDVLLVPK